jgi:hypothetical protein
VGPGDVLVVEAAVLEAAVEDANEAVRERSKCLVMEVALGSVLVVKRSASGALSERAERGLVERVVEAPVADVAGQHGLLLPGRDGQW